MANNNQLDKKAGIDIQLAGGMVLAGLASEQGLQMLQQVLQSPDPPRAIGHTVFIIISQVRDKMEAKGMPIDDKVWLAQGGAVDRIVFEVVGLLYGVLNFEQAADPDFVHEIKDAIVEEMMQSDARGSSPEMQQAPPEQAAPQAAPQGLLMGGMQ